MVRDLKDYKVIEFDASTRISGVDTKNEHYRKGSSDAIEKYVSSFGGSIPKNLDKIVEEVAKEGGTPLVVAKDNRIYGVVYLKDIIKPGIKKKFRELRRAGIKTVMITGDNPLTAATIAAEAGVDDFLRRGIYGSYDRRWHQRCTSFSSSGCGCGYELRYPSRQRCRQYNRS